MQLAKNKELVGLLISYNKKVIQALKQGQTQPQGKKNRKKKLKEYLDALVELRSLASIQDNRLYALTLNNIGCIQREFGNIKLAAKAFRKSIELDEQDGLTHLNYSAVLLAIGSPAALENSLMYAKKALSKIKALNYTFYFPIAQYNYALALQSNRNYIQAIDWLEKAVETARTYRPEMARVFIRALNGALDAQQVRQSKTLGPKAKLKGRRKKILSESESSSYEKSKVYENLYQKLKQRQSQVANKSKNNRNQQRTRDHVKEQLEFLEYLESNFVNIPHEEIEMKDDDSIDSFNPSEYGHIIETETRETVTETRTKDNTKIEVETYLGNDEEREISEANENLIVPCSISSLPNANHNLSRSTEQIFTQPNTTSLQHSDKINNEKFDSFHKSPPKKVLWRQKRSRWYQAILSLSAGENDINDHMHKLTQLQERIVTVDQIAEKIVVTIQHECELVYDLHLFVNYWEQKQTFANTNPTYKNLAENILSLLICHNGTWSIQL